MQDDRQAMLRAILLKRWRSEDSRVLVKLSAIALKINSVYMFFAYDWHAGNVPGPREWLKNDRNDLCHASIKRGKTAPRGTYIAILTLTMTLPA